MPLRTQPDPPHSQDLGSARDCAEDSPNHRRVGVLSFSGYDQVASVTTILVPAAAATKLKKRTGLALLPAAQDHKVE